MCYNIIGVIFQTLDSGHKEVPLKGRYSRDYRLHEYFDEKGRVHVRSEYIGKDWRFLSPEAVIRREKDQALVRCLLAWTAYIGALLLPNAAMHLLYIALPFAFLAVPLFMYADFMAAFRKMKEPLEHRHADRLNNRYPLIAFLWSVFSMIPAAIWGFRLLLGAGKLPGDYVFEACALVLVFLGGRVFQHRGVLEAAESGES